MKLKYITSVILVLLLAASGCKKDSDSPSKTQLISVTWNLDQLIVNGVEYTGSLDLFSLTINVDNTYSLTDLDGSASNGTWVLSNNDTVLELGPDSYVIVSLTGTNLQMTGTARSEKTGNSSLEYFLSKAQ